jgi:malonyl-CoA/methylmalonyl-CoA synthetase
MKRLLAGMARAFDKFLISLPISPNTSCDRISLQTMLEIIEQATMYSHNTAIISEGKSFTYTGLLAESKAFAATLLAINGKHYFAEARVAFMVETGFDYVKVLWGIWQAGGVAVPLALSHPIPSLRYTLEDTQASLIVVSSAYEERLETLARELNIPLLVLGSENTTNLELPEIDPKQRAMILYTSGTTSLPKGVVITHSNIKAQITTLVTAWEWQETDHILCVLPLHHVHGIINVVSCALWSGACCEFLPEFSAHAVFESFQQGHVNVFMAVPTIYFKLIAYCESLPLEEQKHLTARMQQFRLMVSGSAALPVSVMEKWGRISGQRLLERYGMTEIGMALSNPYQGERKAGYVGFPLSEVEIRLVNEQYEDVTDEPGEILVRGKNVFSEYWHKPEATRAAFINGWFKTGDIAVIENGYYRILGRNSTDIIKSGGYKLSALEIEEVLRTHPSIKDCAVVGIDDEEWGEVVAAALILTDPIQLEELNLWLRERLPAYKVPRQYKIVSELPLNAMGKTVKSDVKKLFIDEARA